MLDISKRQMTIAEKQILLSKIPSVFNRKTRKTAKQEIEAGVVESLEFDAINVWDVNGCRPPCCPHCYLFEAGDQKYVYAESWSHFNFPPQSFPTARMRIVRSPMTKYVLAVSAEGNVRSLSSTSIREEGLEFFDNVECELFLENQFPEPLRIKLRAGEQVTKADSARGKDA